MKKMRKVRKVLLLLIIFALSVSSLTAVAEETAGEAKVIGVEEMLADPENWEDAGGLLKVTKDKLSRDGSKSTNVVTYVGKEYTSEIFDFDITFDKTKEGRAWSAIVLRSDTTKNTEVWTSGHSYVIIVRPKFLEVQKYMNSKGTIGGYPCDIPDGTPVNMKIGAVNVEGGVQLICYINGKQIFNIFDNSNYIPDGGYFSLCNIDTSAITVTPAKTTVHEIPSFPVSFAVSEYDRKATSLKASYNMIGDSKATLNWYTTDKPLTWGLDTEDGLAVKAEDLVTKIEGYENKTEYDIKKSDVGKYIGIGIRTEDGTLNLSRQVYINPSEYIIGKNIYTVKNYEKAIVNGVEMQIDENDWQVLPEEIDSVLYMPLRFAAEKTGGEVSWNEAARSVEIKYEGKSALINVGSNKATVDGSEIILTAAPIINYDRTFIAVSDINALTNSDAVLYGDLIAIGNKEDTALSEEDAEYIKKQIMD